MKNVLILMGLLLLVINSGVHAEKIINGSYQLVINGYDWGPAVDKVIVKLDNTIDFINVEDISVVESKKHFSVFDIANQNFKIDIGEFDRKIVNAYLSDKDGNKTGIKSSNYFTLELAVTKMDEGNPFFYNGKTQLNEWNDVYFLTIKSKSNKFKIKTEAAGKVMPDVNKFTMDKYSNGIQTLNYAYYTPEKEKNKKDKSLLIWLHGLGEGGTDPSTLILGNRVTKLVSEETQAMLDNAYVLTPQAPTFWMDNGSGDISKFDGTSIYEDTLMELIKNFVDEHPDINKDKVIVGGCSNGGFMTMRLLVKNPEYFSAAYPICEAYFDNLITDEMIESIKDIPIWFVHSAADPLVKAELTAVPTYQRLLFAGANNIKITLYANIEDQSGLYKDENGNPQRYFAHFSWIHALNNQAVDPLTGESLFEWANKQVKK